MRPVVIMARRAVGRRPVFIPAMAIDAIDFGVDIVQLKAGYGMLERFDAPLMAGRTFAAEFGNLFAGRMAGPTG